MSDMNQIAAPTHLRIARPTRDMQRAEEFWVAGVGMDILWRSDPADTHWYPLTMLGTEGAGWHLELVADDKMALAHPPGPEDLLVLYLGEAASQGLLARIQAAGGRVVQPRNPYWAEHGVTLEDPDGYLLVLSSLEWKNIPGSY